MGARRRPKAATVGGLDVPPELLDGDHQVWHDQPAYRRYMRQRNWSMPAAERMGHPTHPENRRRAAAVGWARDHGITTELGGHADWHRLRALGLID